MRVAQALRVFRGSIHEAEAVWYETARWPAWVPGLDRVESVPEGLEQEEHVRSILGDLNAMDVAVRFQSELIERDYEVYSAGESYGYLHVIPQGVALGEDYGPRDVGFARDVDAAGPGQPRHPVIHIGLDGPLIPVAAHGARVVDVLDRQRREIPGTALVQHGELAHQQPERDLVVRVGVDVLDGRRRLGTFVRAAVQDRHVVTMLDEPPQDWCAARSGATNHQNPHG